MFGAIGFVFLLSGLTNGADLSFGVGLNEEDTIFLSPIGIIEVSTNLYEQNNLQIKLVGTHISSIPDAKDNYVPEYNTDLDDLNFVAIKATIHFKGLIK